MNLKKKTPNIFWPALVLFLGLSACGTKSKTPDSELSSKTPSGDVADLSSDQVKALELERQELQYWQNRRKLVKDQELFEVFSKYADRHMNSKDHFEVFQVLCEGPSCSFRTGSGRGGRAIRLTSEDSVKLFNLLVNLPISKGETGASVDYLGCRRYQLAEVSGWKHTCTVAAPLGMIPHTSLPIPDLTE